MKFCNCETPEHGSKWIAVGGPGNVVDFQICETCGNPIMGTQATHEDDDDGEE